MDPKELYQQYLFWRHEGLNPIVAIEGQTTLLLDGYSGGLTKEQQKIIQYILQNSRKAMQLWNDFGEYLRTQYHLQKEVEQYLFLPKVIDRALITLRQYKYLGQNESIQIDIPDILTLARINPQYEQVFFYLLAPSFKLDDDYHFTPRVVAKETSSSSIVIQIQSGVRYFTIPDYPPEVERRYPDIDIMLANHILRQKGSLLKVEIISGENKPLTVVNFEFDLPIWVDSLQESEGKETS